MSFIEDGVKGEEAVVDVREARGSIWKCVRGDLKGMFIRICAYYRESDLYRVETTKGPYFRFWVAAEAFGECWQRPSRYDYLAHDHRG